MEFTVEPNGDQPTPEPTNENTLKDKITALAKKVWLFLKSPVFLKNIGLMLVVLLIGFWLLNVILRGYTNHNESMQVDNYVGMDLEDAKRKIRKKDFEIEVKEIFGQPADEVTMQYPDPLSRVKEGRTIYLTVKNGKREETLIPDFSIDDNFENYKKSLTARGLNYIEIKEFSAKLSENTVLHVSYKGEKLSGLTLRKGKKAFKGDTVTCHVTTRYSPTISIPKLVCQDYNAAVLLLNSYELVVGRIYGDVADRNSAYVWKQVPSFQPGQQIKKGSQVDIYLMDAYPDGCN
ncbi:MAG: PASTA domain-containing protein [Bacteroidetes bacterium]|nr:MAG: PASTA domain-containing protein [Bacteroidota bacterium]